MRYPHRLRIDRPQPGVQDPETGQIDAPAPTVLYDGAADVQDKGVVLERDADGQPAVRADATAFLADERPATAGALRPGDRATVTWEDGTTRAAAVQDRRRLDATVFLRWLGA